MASKTMKAARYHPDTGKVSVDSIPIPKIDENEVLVRVGSASLCHSDLMLLEGSFRGSSNPVVLGHEGCGTVEKAGANVKGFKEGDRVGFLPIKGCCFTCEGCKVMNLKCQNGNPKLQGFDVDGYFAEYSAVDYRDCIILPESMDMKSSGPIFCAGVTAFNGVDACECQPGDWMAIIGCGGLGQMGILYAKAMGFNVVGIDINDTVLASAKEAGADVVCNSMTNKKWVEELKAKTEGGAAAAVVFSASIAAYDSAPQTLRVNGILMVIGMPSKPMSVNTHDLVLGTYRIKSETTGPPWKLPKAVGFTAKHNIKPRVDFYKLDDINTMIEKMQAGEVSKRMAVTFE